MRIEACRLQAGLGFALLLAAAGACKAATPPEKPSSQAGTFVARADFAIDNAGNVERVGVTGDFPEAVKQLLEKRAAAWRFSPMLWQGRPAATRITRFLRLRLAPTTAGGYALQVVGWAQAYPREYLPPPMTKSYAAVRGHITYAYLATVTEDGRVRDVEALLPAEHGSQQSKAYSRMIAEWLPEWRVAPVVADGKPVACRRIFVHEHSPDRIGTHLRDDAEGWADEIDLTQLPPQDAERLRQALKTQEGDCLPPMLRTKIENAVL